MNALNAYSDRTKRRKIAAEVCRFMEDAEDTENSLITTSVVEINSSNASNDVDDGSFEPISLPLICHNSEDLVNCSSNILEISNRSHTNDSLIAESDLETVCPDRSIVESDDYCDPYLDDFEFIEDADWSARCDDDSDAESDVVIDDNETLQDKLITWSGKFNISHAALSDLLCSLQRYHPSLPKDARTLLHTKRCLTVATVAGGQYYYFGLKYWIAQLLVKSPTCDFDTLTLHVNIDGIPLFNSSNACLWPILGSFKEMEGVFPIAVYCSIHKPDSLSDYLKDFVEEVRMLECDGYADACGKKYGVVLDAVICDAPARAFIKCIKPHNGYNCCERCVQRGQWSGKILLPDLCAPLRTDAGFRAEEDEGHHTGVSPILHLSCGLVSSFPLDYMHLICLGVMRRLICLWVSGPTKLPQSILSAVSDRLGLVRSYIPREFSRKPRSLSEFKLWKATELRLFLVYTGPVALKGLIAPERYTNFLDLSVATRILLSPDLLGHYVGYAEQLMKYFVESFAALYGSDQIVYNVHSLIHLASDARKYGVLDNISSFKYENYLGHLKKLVRRPQQPCDQIVRRILEGYDETSENKRKHSSHARTFSKLHMEGPVTVSLQSYQQYKQYNGVHCFVSSSIGDNCFEVDGKIGLVRNILSNAADDSCVGYALFGEFASVHSLFTDPLDSADLSIFVVGKPSGFTKTCCLTDLKRKFVMLPFKQGFIIMPQMHF